MSSIDDPIDPDKIQELLHKDSYVKLDECEEWKKLYESGMALGDIVDTTHRSRDTVRDHINDKCIHARG